MTLKSFPIKFKRLKHKSYIKAWWGKKEGNERKNSHNQIIQSFNHNFISFYFFIFFGSSLLAFQKANPTLVLVWFWCLCPAYLWFLSCAHSKKHIVLPFYTRTPPETEAQEEKKEKRILRYCVAWRNFLFGFMLFFFLCLLRITTKGAKEKNCT